MSTGTIFWTLKMSFFEYPFNIASKIGSSAALSYFCVDGW